MIIFENCIFCDKKLLELNRWRSECYKCPFEFAVINEGSFHWIEARFENIYVEWAENSAECYQHDNPFKLILSFNCSIEDFLLLTEERIMKLSVLK